MLSGAAASHDLIVSANDGKFLRVQGRATYPAGAPPDSLTVIDASEHPVRVIAEITGIQHSLAGPPQAVAITPDGKLAVIAAPSRYDYASQRELFGTALQFVDLRGAQPRRLPELQIGAHPNGLSIDPTGTVLLAACLDGSVKVVDLAQRRVVSSIPVSKGRLAGVSFTHDGNSALVARRDEGGVAVLEVLGAHIALGPEVVSTGIAPYGIDVSSVGDLAVVASVGLAGLEGHQAAGDADVLSLVDLSKRPFRTVQYLTVPATPEGIAISPDGAWIVAQSFAGSNLAAGDPGHNPVGRLTLFAVRERRAAWVNDVPSGVAAQGVVFAKDGKTVLVQLNVERSIAVFEVRQGKLADTGQRLRMAAGPASIRSMPR
jgi:DNA-binding beta-propeller fold protein YncE